jgi:hypothetical protein
MSVVNEKLYLYNIILFSIQVIALDINLPVKQSFHILHEQVLNLTLVFPPSGAVSLVFGRHSKLLVSLLLYTTFLYWHKLDAKHKSQFISVILADTVLSKYYLWSE